MFELASNENSLDTYMKIVYTKPNSSVKGNGNLEIIEIPLFLKKVHRNCLQIFQTTVSSNLIVVFRIRLTNFYLIIIELA